MQAEHDQDKLQFVMAAHIDSKGRMWMIDSGHVRIVGEGGGRENGGEGRMRGLS